MATGFVQRFKGKIECDSLWVGGHNLSEALTPAQGSTLGTYANNILISASLTSTWTLPPPTVGDQMTLVMYSATGIFVKTPVGSNFGVNAGTTDIVLRSTLTQVVQLLGISTATWQVVGVWSTAATIVNVTLSTST